MNYPKVLLVGGTDVNARLELMNLLRVRFCVSAAGTIARIKPDFDQAGFDYDVYPMSRRVNPISDVRTLISLVILLRCRQPDLVHAFDTKPCVFARLAARLARVPVVVGTLTGLGALYVDDSFTTRTVRLLYESLQKIACHMSDLTIFQNPEDAQQFMSRGIVPTSKALEIPGSGIRTDKFVPASIHPNSCERVRKELGIPSDALLITMISRLIRSKGVLEFASAAQFVRRRHPQIRFLLVGPDDEESVDRLSGEEMTWVSQAITWAGARQDVRTILATSDVFVLPSFYREGIPRVLLEAAAMGLPLITTNSPGCNTVVEDGVNGFLIPERDPEALAEAIVHLVEEPELRQRFGREARQRAIERFDLSKIADQTQSIYLDLLARKGLLTAGNV